MFNRVRDSHLRVYVELEMFEKWHKLLLLFLIVHVCKWVSGCEPMTRAWMGSRRCSLHWDRSKEDSPKLSGLGNSVRWSASVLSVFKPKIDIPLLSARLWKGEMWQLE